MEKGDCQIVKIDCQHADWQSICEFVNGKRMAYAYVCWLFSHSRVVMPVASLKARKKERSLEKPASV